MSEVQLDTFDPVTLEVIRNALPAMTNEMSADLQRASYNMMVYEVRDYCCALIDKKGCLIAQNLGGVSHFVADLGVIIKDAMKKYGEGGFKEGDVLITNHQAVAGQHLNNIVIYKPIFFENELICFSMVRAHWMDVGGLSTGFGGGVKITDPWMEGLQLDQLKIMEEGKYNDILLKVIKDNIRYPESSLGDMRAQIASCSLAERRIIELFSKYGKEKVKHYIENIFFKTDKKCRKIISEMPDGEYEAESWIDDDGYTPDEPIRIHAKVIVRNDEMTIDLSKCSGQRRGAINSRTLAGAIVAFKSLTTPLDPVNEGSFRSLNVVIPEGNVMMAKYPAPMAKWSIILPTVIDTVLKALAPALPDKVPAAHMGYLGGTLVCFGKHPDTQKGFVLQSIEGGGWGGRPTGDGESASVSVCQGDVRNSPIESIEIKAPVLIEERSLKTDSGGAGKYRGGLGLDVKVRNLVEVQWNLTQGRRKKCPPWGLWGGKEGSTSDYLLKFPTDEEWKSVDVSRYAVPKDTEVIIRTPGGGGWGSPIKRDVQKVQKDVIEGYVSLEKAKSEYGVVHNAEDLSIDIEATKHLRNSMQKELDLNGSS